MPGVIESAFLDNFSSLNLFPIVRCTYTLRTLHSNRIQSFIAITATIMRYLDWDVLLFPGHQNSSHVPLKEFRTACYAEHHEHAANVTPLLTTFVPTLPAGEPFQISLHSWSETGPMLTPNDSAPTAVKVKELWQVRVVIDGICVCTENFAIDATWPQIICTSPMNLRNMTLH